VGNITANGDVTQYLMAKALTSSKRKPLDMVKELALDQIVGEGLFLLRPVLYGTCTSVYFSFSHDSLYVETFWYKIVEALDDFTFGRALQSSAFDSIMDRVCPEIDHFSSPYASCINYFGTGRDATPHVAVTLLPFAQPILPTIYKVRLLIFIFLC
jgi:hypothetical protein